MKKTSPKKVNQFKKRSKTGAALDCSGSQEKPQTTTKHKKQQL
jgi:hypothetical protein